MTRVRRLSSRILTLPSTTCSTSARRVAGGGLRAFVEKNPDHLAILNADQAGVFFFRVDHQGYQRDREHLAPRLQRDVARLEVDLVHLGAPDLGRQHVLGRERLRSLRVGFFDRDNLFGHVVELRLQNLVLLAELISLPAQSVDLFALAPLRTPLFFAQARQLGLVGLDLRIELGEQRAHPILRWQAKRQGGHERRGQRCFVRCGLMGRQPDLVAEPQLVDRRQDVLEIQRKAVGIEDGIDDRRCGPKGDPVNGGIDEQGAVVSAGRGQLRVVFGIFEVELTGLDRHLIVVFPHGQRSDLSRACRPQAMNSSPNHVDRGRFGVFRSVRDSIRGGGVMSRVREFI